MKMIEKIILSIVLSLMLYGIFLSRTDLAFFEGTYVREDGLIEWLTVVALMSGCILSLVRAFKLKLQKGKLFLLGLLAFSAVFFFGAGEEISWGQRILGIQSPDFFKTHNSQMETNLHNLILDGVKINKIIFGTFLGIAVAFYFLILPFLYRKFAQIKTLVDKCSIPIPKWAHIGSYIVLGILVALTTSGKRGELLEFGGCWIFFLMYLNPHNQDIYRLD